MKISYISKNYELIPVISTCAAIALLTAKVTKAVCDGFFSYHVDFGSWTHFVEVAESENLVKILTMAIPILGNVVIFCYHKLFPKIDYQSLKLVTNKVTSDLDTPIDPIDYAHIQYFLLKPSIQELISYLDNPDLSDDSKYMAYNLLYLAIGVKPAAFFEYEIPDDLEAILHHMMEELPSIKFLKSSQVQIVNDKRLRLSLITNEEPIPSFDPRNYVELPNESSLIESLKYFFTQIPACDEYKKEQVFSYLLGYGPVWEVFHHRLRHIYKLPKPQERIFKKAHYEQLGLALGACLPQSTKEGEFYSRNFCTLLSSDVDITFKSSAFLNLTRDQEFRFVWDGISAKTPYFKEAFSYRACVMQSVKNHSQRGRG